MKKMIAYAKWRLGEHWKDIIYEYYQVLEKEVITCPDCDSVATVMQNHNQIHVLYVVKCVEVVMKEIGISWCMI